MKKLPVLIMLILLMATCGLRAAPTAPKQKVKVEKPDMEKIRQEVNDPQSKYYFPKLMRQFEVKDTMMTLDQYRHLYLGYMFQEDYNPYRRSEYSSKVEDLYMRDKHTHAECDTIIKYAEMSLKDDPFDLRQMSFLIYAYREKGKNNLANILQNKLNHLLEAIISTGTGLDEENAWIVNNPQHEYNLLNFHDYIVERQEDRPPYYDYIVVSEKPASGSGAKKTSGNAEKGFYFDVRYLLQEYNRKFPEN